VFEGWIMVYWLVLEFRVYGLGLEIFLLSGRALVQRLELRRQQTQYIWQHECSP
jgi:hypothetical protein